MHKQNQMIKVLLITNKDDLTTDYIVKELHNRNVNFFRFNTEDICDRIQLVLNFSRDEFYIIDKYDNIVENLLTFTDIYYRRPKLPHYNSQNLSLGEISFLESEVYYTLEGLFKLLRNKHWLNNIYAMREAENKIYQIILAKEIGFNIPETLLSNEYNSITTFVKRRNCIIKPIHNIRILDPQRPRIVFTSELNHTFSKSEAEFSFNYIQNKIEKQYDIRATIVGEKCFAVAIDSQSNVDTMVDWRKGEHLLKHIPISLPEDIVKKCLKLTSVLNLTYGAIDLILDKKGDYVFLEINPNGQWAWIEHLTGLPIAVEIVKQLCRI